MPQPWYLSTPVGQKPGGRDRAVPWVWMIMLPGERAGAATGRVSLVPLRDLVTILAGEPLTATRQVVGNLQYLLRLDHVSSVDDVLLNAAGAGLAAMASRRWWRSLEPRSRTEVTPIGHHVG